jgi:hypothetical protein
VRCTKNNESFVHVIPLDPILELSRLVARVRSDLESAENDNLHRNPVLRRRAKGKRFKANENET